MTYDDIVQYTTYTNLDDYYNFYGGINYGLPLDFIKCNLNINTAFTYSVMPSIFGGDYIDENGNIVGGVENSTNNMSYRVYTVLGSNISEKIDFTLTWRGRYSEATNTSITSDTGTAKNRYWDHEASASMKFILGGGFTLGSSMSYKHYKGITNNYDEKISCNAFIGYRVFKIVGEINLGGTTSLTTTRTSTCQVITTLRIRPT